MHRELSLSEFNIAPANSSEGDSDRKVRQSTAVPLVGTSSSLAACGGGGGSTSTPPASGGGSGASPSASQNSAPAITEAQRTAARAALHSSISTSAVAISEIEEEGIEPWLSRKMRPANSSSSKQFFEERGYDKVDANRYWLRRFYFDHMIWAEFLQGGNTVRKRMAFALSEILVVSVNELDINWPAQAVGAYWDLLNKHAFGNYRELLEAVTLSPAMCVFLDTRGNQKADPSTGRVPDENYAREVMQLFSIGLHELNQDGSSRLSNGEPIETYNNHDVVGLAKVFTGYDFDYSGVKMHPDPKNGNRFVPDVQLVRQPLTPDPSRWSSAGLSDLHSMDEKRFLGISIPAGTGPAQSLKIALDRLFNHPNVGPFIGRQLIQRLVTSNPSPEYVRRIADVFANNGTGVRGDLGAVFKAIITDPEAVGADGLTSPFFGKLREPALRFAQWGQSFGASSSNGTWEIRNLAIPALLNQVPFRSPSVFNFFRPQYSPSRSQAAANGMQAPEFQIVNETSVAGYFNFIRATIEASNYWTDNIEAKYDYELNIADDPVKLLNHLDLILSAGQLTEFSRSLILEAIQSVKLGASDETGAKLKRVLIGVMLTMTCNDYLIQR